MSSPVSTKLDSIDMVSAQEGWVVGDDGIILHYGVPTLDINFSAGEPGSFFTVSGSNFPDNSAASILINSTTMTDTLPVDSNGGFTFLLNTAKADPGHYAITASVNPSATTTFVLDPA